MHPSCDTFEQQTKNPSVRQAVRVDAEKINAWLYHNLQRYKSLLYIKQVYI
jgi:hypothetical protein